MADHDTRHPPILLSGHTPASHSYECHHKLPLGTADPTLARGYLPLVASIKLANSRKK